MNRKIISLGLIVLVVASGTAFAGPSYKPDLSVYAPENTVQPGAETTFTVQIVNSAEYMGSRGDIPGIAHNVRVELDEQDAPIEVETGQVPLGSVPSGRQAPATFRINVDEDAEPGTYDVEPKIKYEYTTLAGYSVTRHHTPDIELEVSDDAHFSIESVDSDVSIGSTGEVSLDLKNQVDTDISSAVVEIKSGSSDMVFGSKAKATQYIGNWDGKETVNADFDITARPEATARQHPLYVSVKYENEDGNMRKSESISTGIRPKSEPSIRLSDPESDVLVGEKGTVEGTITNQQSSTIYDANIHLSPESETFLPREASRSLGTLEANESANFSYPVQLTPEAVSGPRQISFSVSYETASGNTRRVSSLDTTVDVQPEQSFSIDEVDSNLRVDTEGTLTATIQNEGPKTAHHAVVVLPPPESGISPQQSEYALGDFEPGDTAEIAMPVEVSEGVEPGPRQFAFTVKYENEFGDQRASDGINTRVDIDEQRDVLDAEGNQTSIPAGSTKTVTITLRNQDDQTLSNIDAKAFVDDPLSAENDRDFVSSLEPGEQTQIEFEISADSEAREAQRPLEFDLQYDEEDGDTILSDTYKVPVEVDEPENQGPSLPIILGGLIVLVGIGGYAYTRSDRWSSDRWSR